MKKNNNKDYRLTVIISIIIILCAIAAVWKFAYENTHKGLIGDSIEYTNRQVLNKMNAAIY